MSSSSLTISIRLLERAGDHPITRYFRARVSISFAKKHDNGALISCGWTVGDDLPHASFRWLKERGLLTEISRDDWNHSGCQSSCIRRGATECRW